MPRRRRVLIIANPGAGRARSARRLARVVAALERCGLAVTLRRAGAEIGGVERLARDAEPEFDAIVAAGGDGTFNAVVNGVGGAPRPLALLPFGTANVLAREIGLPRRPRQLAELIAGGEARAIWPGRAGDRLFVMMAGAGFDAEVVAGVDRRLKRHAGRVAFAWALLQRLWRFQRHELRVRIADAEFRAAAIIATRVRRYAGPYILAPEARLDEPLLHVVLFRRSGRAALLRYLFALFLGWLPARHDIAIMACRNAFVIAPQPAPVQADGEIVGVTPVTLAIADKPLYLIRP